MKNHIARVFERVRAVFGRRSPGGQAADTGLPADHCGTAGAAPRRAAPAVPLSAAGAHGAFHVRGTVSRGHEAAFAQVHLAAMEDRREARLQRERRRALALATVGVDAGPRLIHGVRVTR